MKKKRFTEEQMIGILRVLFADQMLDAAALRELLAKNGRARRQARRVAHFQAVIGGPAGLSRSIARRRAIRRGRPADAELRDLANRVKELQSASYGNDHSQAFSSGEQPLRRPQLARFPLAWNHANEEKARSFEKLERILIAKELINFCEAPGLSACADRIRVAVAAACALALAARLSVQMPIAFDRARLLRHFQALAMARRHAISALQEIGVCFASGAAGGERDDKQSTYNQGSEREHLALLETVHHARRKFVYSARY